jgi:hypothetical protein
MGYAGRGNLCLIRMEIVRTLLAMIINDGLNKSIHLFGKLQLSISSWIPAFAGMTGKDVTD